MNPRQVHSACHASRAPRFVLAAVAISVLAACGSRGGTQSSSEAAPPVVEAPKPVVSCVLRPRPVEAPAKASASSKKSAKPAPKKAARSSARPVAAASSSSSPAPALKVEPNADGSCPAGYDVVTSTPAPAGTGSASASSASSAASAAKGSGDERPSRQVKSDDGKIEGTIYGSPAAGSKLARIKIGMTEGEVRRAIGEPDDITSYVTGKAFIPFYFGNDSARLEWIYVGYGSLAFNAGGFGGRRMVMMINHDAKQR